MNRAWMTRVGVGLVAGVGILGQACGDSGEGGTGGTTSSDQSSSATTKSTSTKATATATPTVNVSSSSSGTPEDLLGASCTADADCGPAYTCLKSSDNWPALTGGGPAGGYCTKGCVTAADCGGANICLGNGANAHCAAACEIGMPVLEFLLEPLDPTKCHGREDTPCFERGADSFCRPVCQSDAECGGRTCNLRTGLCDDAGTTGSPLGAECDPNASECAGICVSFTDADGSFCSSYCTFGGENATTECGGTSAGLCLFRATGHELGDSAFCTAACQAQDECQNPLFWCFAINGLDENGFCLIAEECPNGQGDCDANAAGTTCTTTAYGPRCLDPNFPMTGEGGGSSSSASTASSAASSGSGTSSSGSSASGTGGAGGN